MTAQWRAYYNEAFGLLQWSDLALAMGWLDYGLGLANPLKLKEIDALADVKSQWDANAEAWKAASYFFQALNIKPNLCPVWEEVVKRYASPTIHRNVTQWQGEHMPYKDAWRERLANTKAILSTRNGLGEVNTQAIPNDEQYNCSLTNSGPLTFGNKNARLYTVNMHSYTYLDGVQYQATDYEGAQWQNDVYWGHAATYESAVLGNAANGRNIVKPGTNVLIPPYPSWRSVHWEWDALYPAQCKDRNYVPILWSYELITAFLVELSRVGVYEVLEDTARYALLINADKAARLNIGPSQLKTYGQILARENLADAKSRKDLATGISTGFGIAAGITSAVAPPFSVIAGAIVAALGALATAFTAAFNLPALLVGEDFGRIAGELETPAISGRITADGGTPPTQDVPDPPGFDRAFYERLLKAQGHWPVDINGQSYSEQTLPEPEEPESAPDPNKDEGATLPPKKELSTPAPSTGWTTGEKLAVAGGAVVLVGGGIALAARMRR